MNDAEKYNLIRGQSYIFTVKLKDTDNNVRGTYQGTVVFTFSATLPSVDIILPSPIQAYRSLVFTANASAIDLINIKFNWVIEDSGNISLDSSAYKTSLNQYQIQLTPNVLKAGVKYTVTLVYSLANDESKKMTVVKNFNVQSGPTTTDSIGVSVSPTSGIAYSTNFTLTAVGW